MCGSNDGRSRMYFRDECRMMESLIEDCFRRLGGGRCGGWWWWCGNGRLGGGGECGIGRGSEWSPNGELACQRVTTTVAVHGGCRLYRYVVATSERIDDTTDDRMSVPVQ